jgi:Fe2+ or Zn2+ uptake regulation protein
MTEVATAYLVVKEMRLTDKQLEIMKLLWKRKIPMSAVEIVEASDNRTWKEGSIFAIINTLIKKGAVVLAHHKPTSTINVRSYESAIILEECIISVIRDLKVSVGMCINKDELIEAIRKMEDD